MQYLEMVKRVQDYNGFSEKEAARALRLFVEKLAVSLNDSERKDFASRLPAELREEALAADSNKSSTRSFYDELSRVQKKPTPYAKVQVQAVWEVLKEALAEAQVKNIRAQLPKELVEELS